MTVYCDELRWMRGKNRSCHLAGDDLDELHALAAMANIDRKWFNPEAPLPHYTLLEYRRQAAIDAGAVPLPHAKFQALVPKLASRCVTPTPPQRHSPASRSNPKTSRGVPMSTPSQGQLL